MNESVSVDRYGVMGYPIAHSYSPVIHHLFATQTGEQMQYEKLLVAPDDLDTAIRRFRREGGKGINITVPHKAEAARVADRVSDRAGIAGAVNTLTFRGNEIHGDNTDGVGLVRDLKKNLGIELEGANILLLGAGGATRGIVAPLLDEKPRAICISNRTLERAQALALYFERLGHVSACHFAAVPVNDPYDLIVNATSAGLSGELPPYPEAAISEQTLCYDLSYAMDTTPFAAWARNQGAGRSVMGWGMLVEQAAESFRIWRDVRPDTAAVLRQLPINA